MRNKSQADLGRSLAMLHQCDVGDLFGFPLSTRFSFCFMSFLVHIQAQVHINPKQHEFQDICIYRLGSIPLENAWMSSWEEFFVEMRLKDRLMVCGRYPYSFLKLQSILDELRTNRMVFNNLTETRSGTIFSRCI